MQQATHENVILQLTVRNHPGVMTHVCGLFARRAFNVEGILCLPIQDSNQSRIWLLVNDDQRIGQMISQHQIGLFAGHRVERKTWVGIFRLSGIWQV